MTDQPTNNIGQTLGLGDAWQPAPAAWELHPLTAVDGTKAFCLILRTVAGSTGVAMTEANLRELVRQAQEQLTGLSLPTNGAPTPLVPGQNRHQRRHPK